MANKPTSAARETDHEYVERLRGQTCNQFARTTRPDQLPLLLRRVARDLDQLPGHILLDMTVQISYLLDEATATVYFAFDDELESELSDAPTTDN